MLAALAGVDAMFFSHTRENQEAAYNALVEAAESGRLSMEQIDAANARLDAFVARFPALDPGDLSVIRKPEHLAVCRAAAQAGTVLLGEGAALLPIRPDTQRVAVIEFASHLETAALDQGGLSGLGTLLKAEAPRVVHIILKAADPDPDALEKARRLAGETDVTIVATRSAHLNPE